MARVTQDYSGSTVRSVQGADTNAKTLVYARESRVGCAIHNNSSAVLYLLLQNDPGTAVSSSNFTVKLVADAYYEVPFGYTGEVHGVWASVNGDAQVTEFV